MIFWEVNDVEYIQLSQKLQLKVVTIISMTKILSFAKMIPEKLFTDLIYSLIKKSFNVEVFLTNLK